MPSQPVRPPIVNTFSSDKVDIFPNEVHQGGDAAEKEGPEEVEGEDYEEWAPSAPSSPPVASVAEKEKHVMGGHVQYRSWCPPLP